MKARAIAFYLPQFHPIPENDEWWGKGFTEWTNVTKAKPLFPGHYQPHLPADLGFYDLRVPEVREAQAHLAREHGIEGFCYWHYWFGGERLLQRPFDEVLASGKPDFPFCLAWANESWSRRWMGEEKDILIEQKYSLEDDERHAEWLSKVFHQKRYIKVNGRPLFLIYRPLMLPNPESTTQIIRKAALQNGLPNPYIVGINAHARHIDCRTLGFDSSEDHKPQLGALPLAFSQGFSTRRLIRNLSFYVFNGKLKVYDYKQSISLMDKSTPMYPHHPCVFVGWDNTARRGREALVITKNNPKNFGDYLRKTISQISSQAYEERLLFINAWNEWAEGMCLEPQSKYGNEFLNEVKKSIY